MEPAFKSNEEFIKWAKPFIKKYHEFLIEYTKLKEPDKRKVRAFFAMIDDGKVKIEELLKH